MAKQAGVPKRIRIAAAARGCEVFRQSNGDAVLVDAASGTVLTEGTLAGVGRLLANDRAPFWCASSDAALEPPIWIPLNDLVVDD